MSNDIYSAIYDITEDNIEKAGQSFSVSKEAFTELSVIHPQNADIFLLSKEEDNKLFMEKSYIRLLKRLADIKAYENWEHRFSLPWNEFQRLLTMTLITSREFSEKNVNVYNNIYSLNNQYKGDLARSKKVLSVRKAEVYLKTHKILRKIYNRFPECIKKILRKMLKPEAGK